MQKYALRYSQPERRGNEETGGENTGHGEQRGRKKDRRGRKIDGKAGTRSLDVRAHLYGRAHIHKGRVAKRPGQLSP